MNLQEKKKFQWNILFLIFYVVFLFSFPALRNYFYRNNVQISAPDSVLIAANSSTNLVSNVFSNLTKYFFEKKVLLSEIVDLKQELELEKTKNVNLLSQISSENLDLIPETVAAKKIFSDFTTVYNTALLDKGMKDGVEEKNLVFVYPNKAIGKIESAEKNTSRMLLFSRDKNKIEGVLKIKSTKDVIETKNETSLPNMENAENNLENSEQPEFGSGRLSLGENFDSNNSHISQDISESSNVTIKSGEQIIIDVYGYGGGDFIARIPKNIEVALGAKIYLAEDEEMVLGEVLKIEKPEASFHQILLIKGYFNIKENNLYYIQTR